MRSIQIIQGVRNTSSGPTYTVGRLANELCMLGEDSSVLTLGTHPSHWPHIAPLRIHSGRLERKTGVSPALMNEIRRLSKTSVILHGHGIWRITNLFPLLVNRSAPAKIIWSPRGTLSAWSMQYKSIIKLPFWKFLQKPALGRCHCFHATAESEYDDIRRLGFKSPVAIIPNGIDLPNNTHAMVRRKQVVFLSRINPIKGLDLLLPAWEKISRDFSDWTLVIAGPLDNDYAESIREQANNLNATRIHFAGEVLGPEKTKLLSESSLFVLPSYSENFGIAIAEALAHAIPVITTTGTPWSEISGKNVGWYIKPDRNELENSLRTALSLPLAELESMGHNGRRWMQEDYAWPNVAERMSATYKWLLDGGDKPSWIITE